MGESPNSSYSALYPHKELKVSFRDPSVSPVRWSGLEGDCLFKESLRELSLKKTPDWCLQLQNGAVLRRQTDSSKGGTMKDKRHKLHKGSEALFSMRAVNSQNRVHRGTVKSPSLEIFKMQLVKSCRQTSDLI